MKPLDRVAEAHLDAVPRTLPVVDRARAGAKIVGETRAQLAPVQREDGMDALRGAGDRDFGGALQQGAPQPHYQIQGQRWTVAWNRADQIEARVRHSGQQPRERTCKRGRLVGHDRMPKSRVPLEVTIGADDDFADLRGEAF